MPAHLYLEQFGSYVWDVFGTPPYLVGTAVTSKEWRDVDVRLILEDDEFDALLGPIPGGMPRANAKWTALCLAFAALGKQMTGLPIDFQIQRRTQANARYPGPREALGLVGARFAPVTEPERPRGG